MRIGDYRRYVTLDAPGTATADSDGSYTQTYAALTPAGAWARIESATTRNLERITAGTVLSTATHLVSMRYHAGVTTQTRITYGSRQFNVAAVANPDERNIETIAVCIEVVS